jgi:hypothetical protein
MMEAVISCSSSSGGGGAGRRDSLGLHVLPPVGKSNSSSGGDDLEDMCSCCRGQPLHPLGAPAALPAAEPVPDKLVGGQVWCTTCLVSTSPM